MSENTRSNTPPRRPMGPLGGPRGGPGVHAGEKPKDFKKGIARLFKFLTPFKWHFLIVILCCACATVLTMIAPKILSGVTNSIAASVMERSSGGAGAFNFGYIYRTLGLLLGLYLMSALFSFTQGFAMSGVTAKIAYNLRREISDKINRLPVSFFNSITHGEVLSRITNDVDTVSMNLSQSLTQAISTVLTILMAMAMMLSISWRLTLVALLMIPGSVICTLLMVRFSQKYFRAQQRLLGTVNGTVEELFGGHTVIKAFSAEERVGREFDEHNDKLYESSWKALFLTGMLMPIINFIGNLGFVAIFLYGAALISRVTMIVGDVQAFITYIRNFTMPINQLANISSQLQSTAAAAERVFEFLDAEDERDYELLYTVKDHPVKGDVTFEHVRFAYEYTENEPENNEDSKTKKAKKQELPDTDEPRKKRSGEPVIHDFSAEVKAGQKIAIVGPTGAGKTTMVKLLMRFHDLQSGAIYVDGRNTANYARRDLRGEFGLVLQDTWLYNGTIMENIRYGNMDATDDEVIAAARAAQVDHFVRTLPDGYNMVINEESTNISQGQKQLLTIARAILSDSRIMILDEATSSVDTRTEILIQRAMDNLLRGRTSFIIAHRLSTIRNADLILCMRDGDIAEQGTHEELLSRGGFYAELYNSQFERTG
ncbi:MAG: ABC transporter ATP-binding protein [Clostridiales bacterium]|nr:ABC transporter ATP-binding protein [Clostridiales bacterium]